MTATTVGPYRIVRKLGEGGMGEVFLADDTRLHRRVALKALSEHSAPDADHRIIREARAAARLNHPHIAAVHDVIEQDGRAFIVMEYVEGTALADEIRRGPMPFDRIVDAGADIAGALAYAHEHGVLHRDVKAANVIVAGDGNAKLLDLGVAKIVTSAPDAATTAATLAFAGTPSYMSPERILGGEPSPLDDVYSLGVLLFEMTAGRRPFEGSDFMTVSMAITTEEPPDIAALRPGIPAALAATIKRAMTRDRRRRPTAADIAHELLAIRTASDVAHTPAATVPAPRRSTALWLSVGVTVIALSGIAAVWVTMNRGPQFARGPIAILPAVNLTSDPIADEIGTGLVTLLAGNLGAVPGVTIVPPTSASAYRGAGRDLGKAAKELGAPYLVTMDVQRRGDSVKVAGQLIHAGTDAPLWSETFEGDVLSVNRQVIDAVATSLQRQSLLPRRLNATERQALTRLPTGDSTALLGYARGRTILNAPTKENIDDAVKALEQAVAHDPPFALAHAALSEAYAVKYTFSKDPQWIDRATAEATRAIDNEPRSSAVHIALARVYNTTGKLELALTHARTATDLSPDYDEGYRLLGRIQASRGDIDDAKASLQKAISLRPDYWAHHYELGFVLYRGGRYADAIAPYKRVTELRPDYASGFQNLGAMYEYSGDLENAIGNYEQARRLGTSATAYANLGGAHYRARRFDQALEDYTKAVALDPSSPGARVGLGDVHAQLGHKAAAQEAYGEALALAERLLKVNSRDARTIAIEAVCEAKLGRFDEAIRHAREAQAVATAVDNEVPYKVAVVHALAGQADAAIPMLERAIDLNYPRALARQDDDLRVLRGRTDFQKIVQ